MASGATPHFHNTMGKTAIDVGAKEFMCIGAKPPFDHPHVFLDMGTASEISAPIARRSTSTTPSWRPTNRFPPQAAWHEEAA